MAHGLQKAARDAKRTRYPGTPEVAPRQVWADNDKRVAGREVRVDRVEEDFAYCTVVAESERSMGTVGKATRISLDRFFPTATGYRYLRTLPAERE